MSWDALSYVKHLRVTPSGARITPSEKLVLIYLADEYGDIRKTAAISLGELVGDTGLSKPTVIAALRTLEVGGVIAVHRSTDFGNRPGINLYRLPGLERLKAAKEAEAAALMAARAESRPPNGIVKPLDHDSKVALPSIVNPLDHQPPSIVKPLDHIVKDVKEYERDEKGTSLVGTAVPPAPAGSLPAPPEPPAPDPVAAEPAIPAAVARVWDHYRAAVQPKARICPTDKIKSRLKRFSPEELLAGIDHFAADVWYMEHCANPGGAWFFDSDARAEKFLTMEPRKERPNGATKTGAGWRPHEPREGGDAIHDADDRHGIAAFLARSRAAQGARLTGPEGAGCPGPGNLDPAAADQPDRERPGWLADAVPRQSGPSPEATAAPRDR